MTTPTLIADKRKVTGKKVKKLRKEGILPANVYGKKIKSLSLQIKEKDFHEIYEKVGETGILELLIDKDKKPVLIHNIQVNPVDDKPLHVDFLQVDLKEKVTADVPVEVIGESPAEKQGLGTVVTYIDEIEVEALPTDLPEKFEIDTSGLSEIDQAIYVKDLKITDKVEIKNDPESIVVKVEAIKEEVQEVVPDVTEEISEEGVKEGEEKPADETSEGNPNKEEIKE